MTENLHPLFAQILRPHLAVTEEVKPLELYHPGVGNKTRSYQSIGGAFAYEAGFLAFRDGDQPPQHKTPFSDGWHDAAAEHDRRAMDSLTRRDDDGVAA